MIEHRREPASAQPEYQDPLGCLPRIFWMMIGNLAALMAALKIYLSTGWSAADAAYWLLVALLVGARYVDIVRFKGQTMDGEPATMAHLKRYVLLVLVAGAALWIVARGLGPGFH
jgi:hypothetical protein